MIELNKKKKKKRKRITSFFMFIGENMQSSKSNSEEVIEN